MNSSFYLQLTDINCPGDGKCSGQGTCDGKTGTCTCNNGFNGDNCESKCFLEEIRFKNFFDQTK